MKIFEGVTFIDLEKHLCHQTSIRGLSIKTSNLCKYLRQRKIAVVENNDRILQSSV